jgi:hypothetical protein
MNRIIHGLILTIALAAAVWAANPAQIVTQYGMFFTGTSGEPVAVSTSNPVPVTVTAGSVDGVTSVAPKGATSAASTRWLVTSAGQSWTLSASATDFTLFNLGSNTVFFDINMGGATVGASIPLTATGTAQCQQGRDAASGIVVNLIAATPTYVLGVEGRR